MLVVETIAKIRRAFFRDGKPIKAICRDLGVSRKAVRKVIRSGATEFRYEREVQPLPKIGRWSDELDQLLAANEGKASRERLTLIRLYEELRDRGYDGGYDAVRRYARKWAEDRGQATAAAYVPLSFAPGEAYQFDWSHEIVLLNGVTLFRYLSEWGELTPTRAHLGPEGGGGHSRRPKSTADIVQWPLFIIGTAESSGFCSPGCDSLSRIFRRRGGGLP